MQGEDFSAVYEMAKLTGGGFTNLPAERGTLVAKLAQSDQSFNRTEDVQGGDRPACDGAARARHADDLVALRDELPHEVGSEKARCSADPVPHGGYLSSFASWKTF